MPGLPVTKDTVYKLAFDGDATATQYSENIGTTTVTPGPANVLPPAIPSGEVFGGPTLTTYTYIATSGIGSQEALGEPLLSLTIYTTAITSAESVGSPTVAVGPVFITTSGIGSGEAIGEHTVSRIERGSSRVARPVLGDVVHEFSSISGLVPAVPVTNWEATEEVPGGFISSSGTLPPDIVKSNPDVFTYGATWKVTHAQTGETIWAGRLLDPTPQTLGAFQINAKGWGTLLDRQVDRLLYQTRSLDDWTPADSDPHNYDNDNKHDKVDGSNFSGGVVFNSTERKLDTEGTLEYTLPTAEWEGGETYTFGITGRIKDVADETEKCKIRFALVEDGVEVKKIERDVTNTYDAQDDPDKQAKDNDHLATVAYKLTGGKTYKLRVVVTKLKPNNCDFVLAWSRWGKTANITSGKIETRITGKELRWIVRRNTRFHGGETTGLVFWAPANPLSRIAFTIKKPTGNTENFKLILYGMTGPDGALTKLHDWALDRKGNEGDTTFDNFKVDYTIKGDYDQIMLALKRKEGAEGTKQKKFVVALREVRVSGIATTDDFTVSDVAEDIAGRVQIDDYLVRSSPEPVLPLDVVDTTFADVLTDVHLLNDWRWLIQDEGNGPVLDSAPWDERHWFIHGADALTDLIPLERYDEVRYPYKYPGGERQWDVARPDDDPLPKGTLNTYVLQIDDPLPGKEVMEVFAQRICDYLARKRAGGTAKVAVVFDRQGVETTAYNVHAGDVITFTAINTTLRIKSVRKHDRGVDLTFDDSHALLEKLLARRQRRLAMGRSAAGATLADVANDRPVEPNLVDLLFYGRERKERLEYKAKVDWSSVENDIQGEETSIDRYVAQLRPMEACPEFATAPPAGQYDEGDWYYNTGNNNYYRHDGSTWQQQSGVTAWIDEDGVAAFPRFVYPEQEPFQGHVAKRVVQGKEDEDGTLAEPPPTQVWFNIVDRPKRWYYQARVRAVDVFNKQGVWSSWTTPEKAPDDVLGVTPPKVTGLAADFDRLDKLKGSNPLRCIVSWDELTTWDIPGGDKDSDLRGYIIHFRRCDEFGVDLNNGKPRTRFIPAKKDSDAGQFARAVFHQVKKKNHYQFRVRTVSEYGHKGDWEGGSGATDPDGWSLPVTASDTVRPPGVTNLRLDIDQHKARGRWDLPEGEVDEDGDPTIHDDLHHVDYWLEKEGPAGTWVTEDKGRAGLVSSKTWKIEKPDHWSASATGQWRLRVVTVDPSGNKSSSWAAAPSDTAVRAIPDQPTQIPTGNISFKGQGKRGIKAIVTFSYSFGNTFVDDDIDKFAFQMRTAKDDSSTDTDYDWKIVDIKPSEAGATHKVRFSGLRDGWKVAFRYRAVDKKGHKSEWSPWSADKTVGETRRPGPARNVATRPDTKAIIAKWDPPERWSDEGSAAGTDFTRQDVAYYKVQLRNKNTGNIVATRDQVLNTSTRFRERDDGQDLVIADKYEAIVTPYGHAATYADGLPPEGDAGTGGDTSPEVFATSDGIAPTSSPTPSVLGHTRGIHVQWTNIDNPDPVVFEIHMSATSGFAASSSTLVSEVAAAAKSTARVAYIVTKLPSGSSLVVDQGYYFRLVAKDIDGAAAAGTQAGPVAFTKHKHSQGPHKHGGGAGHSHPHTGSHKHNKSHSHTHTTTHKHNKGHTHTHSTTHKHNKSHSHFSSSSHSHYKKHKHKFSHKHAIVRHTGHGHSHVSDGDHGHGGSTGTPSGTTNSFPAAGGNHTHSIQMSSTHNHSFTTGGAHAHGGLQSSSTTGDDTNNFSGRVAGGGSEDTADSTESLSMVDRDATESSSNTSQTFMDDTLSAIAPPPDFLSEDTDFVNPGAPNPLTEDTDFVNPGAPNPLTEDTDLVAPGSTDSAAEAETGDPTTATETGTDVEI